MQRTRLAVDIGGTFTDVALELGDRRLTAKTLTTTAAPEKGVLTALGSVTAEAGIAPDQVGLIIHGTTLATNALIERKGAKTGLITTAGFADVLEIGTENAASPNVRLMARVSIESFTAVLVPCALT